MRIPQVIYLLVASVSFLCVILFKNNLITKSEHEKQLEQALQHIMIRQFGIYTLLGSKPMTEFDIEPNHQTDEGHRRGYELICNNDKKFKKSCSFEKFKKCQTRPYDKAKLWDFWKNHWKEYTGPQFLFFECIEGISGVFINIHEMAYVMDEYREEFSKVLGDNFDPISVIKGFPSNPEWEKVRSNSILFGLLYGFGKKNAYLFSLRKHEKIPFITNLHYQDRRNIGRTIMNFSKRKLRIEELPIPAYFSFSPTDDQFVREQEKIIALYKNKDFLKTTLTFLNPPTPNPGETITIRPSELR